MDFAAFADWDWTASTGDSDDQSSEETKGFAYSQTSGLLFLIDCSPSMFVKKEDDENAFDKCLRCIKNMFQKKVITNEKDVFAVVLYGLGKSSSDDGKSIYILQDLDQLNIKRILEVEEILEDSMEYAQTCGHSQNYEMSDVFWVCSNVFAKTSKTLGEKRVLLFTNEDSPHNGDANLLRKAAAKSTDLRGMGIDLELLPMKRDDKGFDMNKFYAAVLYDDHDSVSAEDYPEPSEKFEELLSRVYRKEHKRRAMGRIPLKIGNSVELSVGVYSLCRRTSAPTSVKIHRDTNSEVKTQTRVYNKETGDDVMPQDIKLFQSYGGKKLCLGTEEVNKMKQLGISGLKLIGFKKLSEVKLYLHVKPSHFLYPDETVVKGSSKLFSALLARCSVRQMALICWYRPRSNSPLELIYLLPQPEVRNELNEQTTPPGFHVIFAPFKEDLRELDIEEDGPTASADQVDKCKAMVKKLTFPYQPGMFDNPTLQKFYSSLEAIALNKDEPNDVTDYTIPDVTRIDKKIRREAEEFYGSVFPENFSFGASGVKRAASSAAKGPSKKAKEDISNIDAKELARTDQLNKLTVNDLKELMRKEGIKASVTKKADIISVIKGHFDA